MVNTVVDDLHLLGRNPVEPLEIGADRLGGGDDGIDEVGKAPGYPVALGLGLAHDVVHRGEAGRHAGEPRGQMGVAARVVEVGVYDGRAAAAKLGGQPRDGAPVKPPALGPAKYDHLHPHGADILGQLPRLLDGEYGRLPPGAIEVAKDRHEVGQHP